MGKIYKGQAVQITVNCGMDISEMTGLKLIVKKPGSTTEVEWTGTLYGTNYIRYTTSENDLADPGVYQLQAAGTSGGVEQRGEKVEFRIYDYMR